MAPSTEKLLGVLHVDSSLLGTDEDKTRTSEGNADQYNFF